MGLGQSADVGNFLSSLYLGDMANGKEDRRLCEAVHRHVEKTGKVRQRTAHPKSEGDDPHVFDR